MEEIILKNINRRAMNPQNTRYSKKAYLATKTMQIFRSFERYRCMKKFELSTRQDLIVLDLDAADISGAVILPYK